MKNLISTLILGAGLVFSGCGEKKENLVSEQITESDLFLDKEKPSKLLEKYNSENKQVYEDFVEFVKETKSYGKWGNGQVNKNEFLYECNFKGQNLRIRLDMNRDLRVMINFMGENWESWSDRGADGLIEEYGKESLGRDEKQLSKFTPEKQLEIHENCTNIYKEIMRDEKFKEY